MSVNGVGGGSANAMYQQMLKRAQREEAAQARGAGGEHGGDDKPEITKTRKEKDEDKKTPKELMEELLERIAEKRQDEKFAAERAAEKASAEELTVTGHIVDMIA